mmetsp:Transcript_12755/g.22728  ORF Transcript_12755/g.22728 Transcript_12755/m.22728 type:complete len:220 (-) Transcript_12755:137-796(-)
MELSTTTQAKRALRKTIEAKLKQLSQDVVMESSVKIASKLLQRPEVSRATCVSIYLAMPQEANTNALVEGLFKEKKRLFVPKVVGKASDDMKMPEIKSEAELGSLKKSKWGIPEFSLEQLQGRPDGLETEECLVDLVLVPGVAFTPGCQRLGHGKGYYDCFLAKLQAARAARQLCPAKVIGIALDEQIVDEVPLSPHDVALDSIMTPTRVFEKPTTSEV